MLRSEHSLLILMVSYTETRGITLILERVMGAVRRCWNKVKTGCQIPSPSGASYWLES